MYTAAMNEHPAFLVYRHLPKFFASRGVGGPALDAPRGKFIADLDLIGYCRVEADGGRLVVLILAPASKYVLHGPDLRQLLSVTLIKGKTVEVLVFAPEKAQKKSNIYNVILASRKLFKPVMFDMYPYHVLSVDIPRCRSVPRHTVVPNDEVAAFLKFSRLRPSDLNVMRVDDPPVVWIGGRAGQVVRTESSSETTGIVINYWLLR